MLRWRWLKGGPRGSLIWLRSLPFLSNRLFFGAYTFFGFYNDFNLLGGFYICAVAISLSSMLKCCRSRVCSLLYNSSGVPSESSPVGMCFPSLWNVPYSELCKAATAYILSLAAYDFGEPWKFPVIANSFLWAKFRILGFPINVFSFLLLGECFDDLLSNSSRLLFVAVWRSESLTV